MNAQKLNSLSGYILEEEAAMTLAELCGMCQTPAETIIKMVNNGVISPLESTTKAERKSIHWRFHRSAYIRADKALRLKQDLGVNLAGAALALELLDEIAELRARLNQSRIDI